MKPNPTVSACLFFLILCSVRVCPAAPYTDQDCIGCHTNPAAAQKRINIADFTSSVHQDMGCTDCHTDITNKTHESRTGSAAVNCRICHETDLSHGRDAAAADAPRCRDCHTRHRIRSKTDPASSIHPNHLRQTCKRCHPRKFGKKREGWLTWQVSSHEKQDFSRMRKKTDCIGCHQGRAVHGKQEKINAQNCRTCHFDPSGNPALWGLMHPNTGTSRIHLVFYGVLLITGVILFLQKRILPGESHADTK